MEAKANKKLEIKILMTESEIFPFALKDLKEFKVEAFRIKKTASGTINLDALGLPVTNCGERRAVPEMRKEIKGGRIIRVDFMDIAYGALLVMDFMICM